MTDTQPFQNQRLTLGCSLVAKHRKRTEPTIEETVEERSVREFLALALDKSPVTQVQIAEAGNYGSPSAISSTLKGHRKLTARDLWVFSQALGWQASPVGALFVTEHPARTEMLRRAAKSVTEITKDADDLGRHTGTESSPLGGTSDDPPRDPPRVSESISIADVVCMFKEIQEQLDQIRIERIESETAGNQRGQSHRRSHARSTDRPGAPPGRKSKKG